MKLAAMHDTIPSIIIDTILRKDGISEPPTLQSAGKPGYPTKLRVMSVDYCLKSSLQSEQF